MRRKLALMALIVIALAACGGGGKKSKKATSSPSPPPPPRSFLTGLIVADAAVLGRPVVAVKVENSINSRPQSGLNAADIVYEVIAEGGITRFMPLYQSQDPGDIGPVRSARLVDPDILVEYRAALAYSGAHPIVESALERSNLVLLSYGRYPNAFRRTSRPAPHNVFTTLRNLYGVLGKRGTLPPQDLFAFEEHPPALVGGTPTGTPAATASASPTGSPSPAPSPIAVPRNHIRIPFSFSQTSIWKYDKGKDEYLRWQGDAPHKLTDGSQVSSRNVLLLFVEIGESRIVDAAGNKSPEIKVVGEGKLVLFRNGLRVLGTWKRSAVSGRTSMLDENGNPILLAPGRTWIELVPMDVDASSS